jgi:RNA polymerase sigma-70 factor (ECF subfamily)
LLAQVRDGDAEARNRLAGRYLPILQRWARGQLPSSARDLADTDDLVQVTLLKALERVDEFEPRREGAFLAYLRRILRNKIRDHIRKVGRRPGTEQLDENIAEQAPSPLEEVIGRDALRAYETALTRLSETQREAVILRLELGFTHQEVANAIGSPSWNAARMLVARALIRLAEVMDEQG